MNTEVNPQLPVNYDLLTQAQRREIRLLYIEQQKNLCYHCQTSLDGPPAESISCKSINWSLFPKEFLKYPIHLHHSHDTGMTIGAVHAYCNAVLWQYHNE